MRGVRNVLVALAWLVGPLAAQAASTATVTQPLVVTASSTGSQTVPVGLLPAGGVRLVSPGASTTYVRANLDVVPFLPTGLPSGGTGWHLNGSMDISLGFPVGAGSASVAGQIQLHFTSPQPVSGLLYMWPGFQNSPPFQGFTGDATLDVDCNGVPDHAASALREQNVQIPVILDSTGRSICIRYNLSGSLSHSGTGGASAYAHAYWNIVFLPGAYGLERRRSGCAPIYIDRGPYVNNWSAAIVVRTVGPAPAPILLGFFLLGLAEQNTPLQAPPNCPLLVASPAALVPSLQTSSVLALYPPNVAIPSGTHLYCQAIWMDTQINVYTSDSIRTF